MVDVPTVSGEDGEPVLSRSEEDALVRESTAAFPAFVAGFYRAMLNVFDNLPEPGKQGRVGGKIEEQMLSSLNAACETVTSSLSPALFDQALAQFVQHVAHSPRANSAKAVGHMAASFARADAVKTLGKLFDLCESQIRLEIESGAGSSPTTSSATPMEGDMTLQWYCLLLAGAIAQAGEAILPYADRIVGLVRYMMNTVKSERAYTHTGRLLAWLLASPLSFWTRESRFVNADEYAAEGASEPVPTPADQGRLQAAPPPALGQAVRGRRGQGRVARADRAGDRVRVPDPGRDRRAGIGAARGARPGRRRDDGPQDVGGVGLQHVHDRAAVDALVERSRLAQSAGRARSAGVRCGVRAALVGDTLMSAAMRSRSCWPICRRARAASC